MKKAKTVKHKRATKRPVTMTLRLPIYMVEFLDTVAKASGVTRNDLINVFLAIGVMVMKQQEQASIAEKSDEI